MHLQKESGETNARHDTHAVSAFNIAKLQNMGKTPTRCPVRSSSCVAIVFFVTVFTGPAHAQGTGDPKTDELIREVRRLTDEAVQLRKDGKLPEAIKVWRKRLAVVREAVGSEFTESVAGSLEILAEMHEANRDLPAAARALRDAAEIREKLHPPGHWRAADAKRAVDRVEKLAAFTDEQRADLRRTEELRSEAFKTYKTDLRGAVEIQQRAIALQVKLLGKDHPDVGHANNALGFFHQFHKQYSEALRHYETARGIFDRSLGVHPETARILRGIGNVQELSGKPGGGAAAYRAALDLFAATLGEGDSDTLLAMDSVASSLAIHGDVGGAVRFRRRHLEACRKHHPADHALIGKSLTLLGRDESAAGDTPAASTSLHTALEELNRAESPDPRVLAQCYVALGLVARMEGNAEQASSFFRRSHKVLLDALGSDDPEVRAAERYLLGSYIEGGDIDRARRLLESDVRTTSGDAFIRASIALAHLELRHGSSDAAARLLAAAEDAIRTRPDSISDLEKALAAAARAILLAQRNDTEESFEAMTRSRRAALLALDRGLNSLSLAQQQSFAVLTDAIPFFEAASLGVAKPEHAAISAEWVINGKGRARQALGEQLRALRDSADPSRAELERKWQAARDELAALIYIPVGADPAEQRVKVQQAAERERALARDLAAAGGTPSAPPLWIALADVRSKLAADEVLVEFVRFQSFDLKANGGRGRWGEFRFAAWVIPPAGKGDVRVIDLGPAAPIEEAVAQLSKEMSGSLKAIEESERDAERAIRARLVAVADRVITPLATELRALTRWTISPDGALWLVPWSALPGEKKDGYVAEERVVRLLSSGRALLEAPPPAAGSQPLIVADPDYDAGSVGTQPKVDALEAGAFGVKLPRVARLPETEGEANVAAPLLEQATRQKPQLYTGADAVEGRVKAARSPAALVLCTHGFFLPAPKEASPRGPLVPAGYDPGRPFDNPWLRCGLLFAGCNKRTAGSSTDGILTGLEVLGLNLSGTRLVVLSACETGLGDVGAGDGVAALNQAFQLSGARAVLGSLWRVEDQETARLMGAFFRSYAKGKPAADALAEAQRSRIAARRTRGGAAHPFLWAAFIATGPDGK